MDELSEFRFKKFVLGQNNCAIKVNTDGVLLGAWSESLKLNNAVDIGTGTGIIALMLAQRNPKLLVDALEIDQQTFIQAEKNIKGSPFSKQVMVFNTSVQEFAPQNIWKYDLVISNPPYFSLGPKSKVQNKSNAKHTLLLTHDQLCKAVQILLSAKGQFDIILPYKEGNYFKEIAKNSNLYLVKSMEVKTKENRSISRILMRFGRDFIPHPTVSELIIHGGSAPNQYSDDYISLTKDFYIFM